MTPKNPSRPTRIPTQKVMVLGAESFIYILLVIDLMGSHTIAYNTLFSDKFHNFRSFGEAVRPIKNSQDFQIPQYWYEFGL